MLKLRRGKQVLRRCDHVLFFSILSHFQKQFQDVINAGAEYYTEMLAKQTELMKLRMKLLKSKYKNEKLKQVVLKNQISTLGIQIEESSESSSDSEDSNDEMDD